MPRDTTIQSLHTWWILSFSLAHPVPLSLLVEQNDDQLGVHLVSILTERQITPLKRHIHQVPVEGNMEERDRQRDLLRHTSLCRWQLPNILFALKTFISFLVQWLNFPNIKVSLGISLFLSDYIFRQTHWHDTNSSSVRKKLPDIFF